MYFQYTNCEWGACTSVFFSMHVIVKSTWWWTKMAQKHVVDDNWMYNVLKVVFALTTNTDIDQQTQQHDGTKICSTIYPRCFQVVSFYQVFTPELCMHFGSVQCVLHSPPMSFSWFDQPINIWQGVQILICLIGWFYPVSYYFLFLKVQMISSAPHSWTPSLLCSSLNVTDLSFMSI